MSAGSGPSPSCPWTRYSWARAARARATAPDDGDGKDERDDPDGSREARSREQLLDEHGYREDAKTLSRANRRERTVLAYTAARGAAVGSIIAAIIRNHMTGKDGSPRHTVPGCAPPLPRARPHRDHCHRRRNQQQRGCL